MKSLRPIFILSLLIILTQACKKSKTTNTTHENNSSKLIIFQNNTEIPIKNLSETVEIERKKFSLRFYNKKYKPENKEFYSAQIAAFLNPNELDKIKIGMKKTDLSCFKPGSAMAPARSGKYETLIFNNNGHHYVIYENPENKRLNLIDDSGKLLKLEFEINSLYYNNKEVKMENTELNKFYIAFLIDRNLNGIIDKGELNKLTIKIK